MKLLSVIVLVFLVGICAAERKRHHHGRSHRSITDHFKTGTQAYRVRGRIFCGNKPAANVQVMLIDNDTGPDPDDTMDSGYSDSDGRFDLLGDTMEGTTIDPFLKIYHDCDDGIRPCQRRWKFELPNSYISMGNKMAHKKVLEFGDWNLETRLPDEEHDCIH